MTTNRFEAAGLATRFDHPDLPCEVRSSFTLVGRSDAERREVVQTLSEWVVPKSPAGGTTRENVASAGAARVQRGARTPMEPTMRTDAVLRPATTVRQVRRRSRSIDQR